MKKKFRMSKQVYDEHFLNIITKLRYNNDFVAFLFNDLCQQVPVHWANKCAGALMSLFFVLSSLIQFLSTHTTLIAYCNEATYEPITHLYLGTSRFQQRNLLV